MASNSGNTTPHPVLAATHIASVRSAAEKRLGILHYASPVDFGWHGDIRKRYTDFLVHEVRKDGSVIHLSDFHQSSKPSRSRQGEFNAAKDTHVQSSTSIPSPAPPTNDTSDASTAEQANPTLIPDSDKEILSQMLGDAAALELIGLDTKAQQKDGSARGVTVSFPPIQDREQRTKVHQEVRRIFSSRLETQVGDGGIINARAAQFRSGHRGHGSAANGGRAQKDSSNWRGSNRAEPRPHRNQYLHFTLYKENKDTMDAINHIARLIKVKASNFGFAGTKDRRAATVQRVSVWNKDIKDLVALNDKMSGIRVGDFAYQKKPMQLGQHGGNQFVIVIKNVQLTRGEGYSIAHRLRLTERCVQHALDSIVRHGFINYFGLQRFGTHAVGTQEIGMKILREDFMAAVDGILHVDPDLSIAVAAGTNEARFHKDEFDRARAIAVWKMSGKADAALKILPKKYGAEGNLIRHLGRSPNDYCGALLSITRGLRQLYCHAYQSYVWNYAASERWARYGDQVVAGDLVLVQLNESPITQRPPVEDMSEDVNQQEEEFYQRARPVSKEEAASGRYTIFDVVLPAPGFDVIYPSNEIGNFYSEFMGREENGGMNPYDMRRRQREFSLSGHYRKLMAKFTATPMFAVRPYSDDEEQMHPTDRDTIEWRQRQEAPKIQKSSAAWSHFASNAQKFDAALADDARRRRMQSPDEPTETRINDAWIETGLDGGKRMRVNDTVKRQVLQRNVADDSLQGNARAGNAESVATSTESKPGSDSGDVQMGNAETDQTCELGAGAAPSPVNIPEADNSGRPASEGVTSPKSPCPDLMSYLQAHLKKSAEGAEHGNTSHVLQQSPLSDKPADVTATGDVTTEQATAGNFTESTTPRSPVINVFEGFEKCVDKDHPAVNVSGQVPMPVDAKGEKIPVPEDKKIAVILSFTLNSSNYATICIREMMGQVNA